jgi:hypothetical protein
VGVFDGAEVEDECEDLRWLLVHFIVLFGVRCDYDTPGNSLALAFQMIMGQILVDISVQFWELKWVLLLSEYI